MPRLSRLRFVSVGYPNARFDDLTLDFRDADGHATESTLWLRNGGGKSSILNLFFAGVRPGRREFLGAKAKTKRALSEYVQASDKAVVVYEWELDAASGRLDFERPERFLTGTFYERRGSDLKPLFFSCRASSEDPRLTLEGLPLYREENGRRVARRNLNGFRQEWHDVQKQHPHCYVYQTDVQKDWRDLLDKAGIDTELFRYQMMMNHREGGADDMFRFDSHDDFVRFLLELVLDNRLGETVRSNIEKHRDDLRRAIQRLRPERELLDGLTSRLAPMRDIARERTLLRIRAGDTKRSLDTLTEFVASQIDVHEQQVGKCSEVQKAEAEQAALVDEDAKERRRFAATLRLFAAEVRLGDARSEDERQQRRLDQARRDKSIWAAAIPLRNARRFERIAAGHREALERKQTEHQPLFDELTAAANQYAAALTTRVDVLESEEAKRHDAVKSERRSAALHHAESKRCAVAAAESNAAIKRLSDLLTEADRERKNLENDGILQPDESASRAIERIDRSVKQEHDRREAQTRDLQSTRSRQVDLRTRQSEEQTAIAAFEVREQQALQQLEAASAARAEIESNSTLRSVLEVETVDVEQLTDASLRLLSRRAGQEVERVVTLRIAQAEGERAVRSLEEHGLLPPSVDAERVLNELVGRVRAWSGWGYLSENAAGVDACRKVVQKSPQLVTGVIVADDDFSTARSIIENAGLQLDSPVVVAPQSAFGAADVSTGIVVGPESDAFFDRSAAHREHLARQEQLDRVASRMREAETRRRDVDELESRLQMFRQAWPPGWFAEQAATIDQVRTDRAAAANRVEGLGIEIDRGDDRIQELERLIDESRSRLQLLDRQRQRAVDFRDRHETEAVPRQRELDSHRQSALDHEAARQQHEREAERAEQRAADNERSIRDSGQEIARVRLLLEQIEFRTASPTPASPELAEVLAANYRRLKAQYEDRVGADGLLHLAAENDENARRERDKLASSLGESITEQDVAAALGTLDDPESAERAERRASEQWGVVLNDRRSSEQAVKSAEARFAEAGSECEEFGASEPLSDTLRPPGVDEAEQSALREDEHAEELEQLSQQHRDAAAAAEARRREAEQAGESMRHCHDRLGSTTRSYGELLERLIPECGPDEPRESIDEQQLRERLNQLETALQQVQHDDRALSARAKDATRAIRKWVGDGRFDQLQSRIVRELRTADEVHFEDQADYLLDQLELRLSTINDKLDEIDGNRDQLVSELQAVAEDGLNVLRSAANQSRFPDNVPGLAGVQFLTISMKCPDDPAEQRSRLAALIDELVDCEELPSASGLIQSAVLRVARPIRARVINPDPQHSRQRIDIPDLVKFSGGERLTCAVLLYCTLSQLRTRNRGQFRRPSGVLLLDNPIGSASRASFVRMQLDVARAMRIQLIYTTGVNDYEALQPLPNLIRLRNDRVNRNNGHHLVEHDDQGGSPIEAVRVVRQDRPAERNESVEENRGAGSAGVVNSADVR